MRSFGVTLTAGEESTLPLTATRPAAISPSASRREATPARASRLAIRSSVCGAVSVGAAPPASGLASSLLRGAPLPLPPASLRGGPLPRAGTVLFGALL